MERYDCSTETLRQPSPWSAMNPIGYERIVNLGWRSRVAKDVGLTSPHDVAASILMAVLFFGVGLELARERRRGALAHWRHAAAPVLAAVGAMTATAAPAIVVGSAPRPSPQSSAQSGHAASPTRGTVVPAEGMREDTTDRTASDRRSGHARRHGWCLL
ncbi:MAG: Na+/H+ antiporter NhaA [Actinomycetales bacterium]|nr:Na+/H+ antiporter NhaA [Actinomycetales bacterium]